MASKIPGFHGQLLDIDLTAGTVKTVDLDPALQKEYFGARAMGGKMLLDAYGTNWGKVDALSRHGQGRPEDESVSNVASNFAGEFALAEGKVVEMADDADALQLEGAQAVADRAEIGDIAEPAADEFLTPDDEEGMSPAGCSGSALVLGNSAGCADACGASRDPGMSAGLLIPAQGLEPY